MTNRVVMGHLGSSVYGLKVSKATYDVLSATAEQLIFDSTADFAQIVASGTMTISNGTTEETVTFGGGFTYAPLAIAGKQGDVSGVATTSGLPFGYTLEVTNTSLTVTRFHSIDDDVVPYAIFRMAL